MKELLSGFKKSQQRPQVQMCAVFVALILKFQSVISAETTSIFQPERAAVDKIRVAVLFKIHLGVDPQVGKSSCERKTASFCSRLTEILQDKKQTDDQNQNIL